MPDNLSEIGEAVQKTVAAGADAVRDRGSRMADDLRSVIRDGERLLRNAGDASRDGLSTAREQLEQALSDARERLLDAEEATRARLSRAAGATSDFISENPVRALLIAAAAGAVVAWLMTRGRDDYPDDESFDEADEYGNGNVTGGVL